MKLKLIFELSNLKTNVDIKRTMISYIKHSLELYDKDLYNQLYGSNKIKPFTFSLYLPGVSKQDDEITLSKNMIILEMSSNDIYLILNLYNAFQQNLNKEYPFGKEKIECKKIEVIRNKEIKTKNLIIKFKSPLVIRKREKNEDKYFTVYDKEFKDKLLEIVNYQLESLGHKKDNSISLLPISSKQVIDTIFGLYIPASIGIYMLSAKQETLNILYQIGIGSRRGEGFGMFEIIEEVKDDR